MTLPPPSLEYCVRHPQIATGRHCTRCDRPACNNCLTPAPVGSHCADCIRSARPPARERVRRWNAVQHIFATRVLIALNVFAFLWTLTSSGSVERNQFDLGLSLVFIQNGEWYRIVTSGFLHFGLLHIGMNMLLLWQLGQLLEPALGQAKFTLLYFAAMFGGAAGALALTPDGLTGGASGAVFGLMAAAAVGLQQRGVNPMRTGIGTTLILNLLITFAIPGISIGGHVGGALTGAVVGYAMLEPRWTRTSPVIGWAVPVVAMALSVFAIGTML
ncbi:MAG: rhomboid family intramembrane serine protease [Acidimicrobiaceae bacterium]